MADLAARRFFLKRLLSLPTPALRAMSGGGVVYQGGRTLDPRFQYLAHQAKALPPPTGVPPEPMRIATARTMAMLAGPLEPGVSAEMTHIEGPRGPIPVRVYRSPRQDPATPVMVYSHFGGGVIGDLDVAEAFCSILASEARCAVLSVDYRLAPEHRFPAGLEDVLAVFHFARDHAERFGAPAGQAAIGGDSMGGSFAAIIAQEMKRTGERQPALQLLVYPLVDIASETPSMTTYAEAYPLSLELLSWFTGHYLPADADPADPRLSPIRTRELTGLAPAVVITAGFDILADQGEAYAKRLRGAGVPVAYRCYDHLAHGFTAYTGVVPAADVACREIAGLVREGLEGKIP